MRLGHIGLVFVFYDSFVLNAKAATDPANHELGKFSFLEPCMTRTVFPPEAIKTLVQSLAIAAFQSCWPWVCPAVLSCAFAATDV